MLSQETLQNIAQNQNFVDKSLLLELTELLKDKAEASEFLFLYGQYGELMDDVVDEPQSIVTTERMADFANKVNNCAYWIKHRQYLWVIERLIHNAYFDTVRWEKADEEWKRRDAKAMSHCGYYMLFAVILIEFGIEKLNEISLRFRNHAHLKHINDPI